MNVKYCKECLKHECDHPYWKQNEVYDLLYPTVYVLSQLGYEFKDVRYTYRNQTDFDFKMEVGGFDNVDTDSNLYEFRKYKYRGEIRKDKKYLYASKYVKEEYKNMDTRYLKNMFHLNFYYDLYLFASSLPVLKEDTGIEERCFNKDYFIHLINKRMKRNVCLYVHPDEYYKDKIFNRYGFINSNVLSVMFYDNCASQGYYHSFLGMSDVMTRLDIKAIDKSSGYVLGTCRQNRFLMNTFDEVIFGDIYNNVFFEYYKIYIDISLTEVLKRYYKYLKDTYNIGNCYFSNGDVVYVFIEKGSFSYSVLGTTLVVYNGTDDLDECVVLNGNHELFVLCCNGLVYKEKFYYE